MTPQAAGERRGGAEASGIPDGLHPIVGGFTGSGNVSLGAQEIFDRLPIVFGTV